MASATGSPFDGFPSGITQSSPPRRRANGHQSNVRRSQVDLAASVPALRGRLHLPRRARPQREWATSPRRYRVWVGWRAASVSDNAMDLLALIDGRRSIRELAETHARQQGRPVHPMEVVYLVQERLAPAGLIRLRGPQWEGAPALSSPNQPGDWAAPALASQPAGAPTTTVLPSPAPADVDELVSIDALDTIIIDRPVAIPLPTRIATPIPTPEEPVPYLAGDETPTLLVPRLPATPSPAGDEVDEVYIDEQPTMLLAPLEVASAPTALPGEQVVPAEPMGMAELIDAAEPAEPDAEESLTVVVRPSQTSAPVVDPGPNPLEPLGAGVAAVEGLVALAPGRPDTSLRPWQIHMGEPIGLTATHTADEGTQLARSDRQALDEVQRATVAGLAQAQAGASAVAWPAGGHVGRLGLIGQRLRTASGVVVGLVLLGLALTLGILSQTAYPSVVRQMASPTAAPPTPTPLQERILPGETAYVVQQGDTLASIASAYHITQNALLLVNGDILTGTEALTPGMRLAIPAIYRPALPASVQPRPLYYVVQSGDTLYLIGQRFGLDWHVIANYNHVTDPRTLAVGQGLVIPAAGT